MVSEAPNQNSSGIAVFYCEAENFTLEELCLHGPNVISFKMESGGQWWYVVG